MAKKPPKPIAPSQPLSRKRSTREPLTVFYIYTEGKVAEPEYISSFYRDLCEKRAVILDPIKKAAGVPRTIVEACVKRKDELHREAKRNSFDRNYELWAVFDIDNHPNVDEAIALAQAHGIRCIISNPCVEVWRLMHRGVYERPSTRQEAQAELAKVLPDYHHDDNPIFPWRTCKDLVDAAKSNSIKALLRRTEEGQKFPKGNPSTNFQDLLAALNADKKN